MTFGESVLTSGDWDLRVISGDKWVWLTAFSDMEVGIELRPWLGRKAEFRGDGL